MEKWLSEAKVSQNKHPCRGLIGPHAGFSYSGPTAAYAYKCMDPTVVKRVFILGPSHHYYTDGCEVTECKTYQTPINNLTVDQECIAGLMKTGKFKRMSKSVDEEEHSIEMHLPYIAHVMKGKEFQIVPILVGSLNTQSEKMYGQIFAPYLKDPTNFFVVSSDFCHWGSRFRYTKYDKSLGAIWQSIEQLDKAGMELIEKVDAAGFAAYLADQKNTICGRHPIGVFLNALRIWKGSAPSLKFLHYAQSSKCKVSSDSSVSYAAGVCYLCESDKTS